MQKRRGPSSVSTPVQCPSGMQTLLLAALDGSIKPLDLKGKNMCFEWVTVLAVLAQPLFIFSLDRYS